MRKYIMPTLIALALVTQSITGFAQDYKNPNLNVETRVKDLLKRMTIQEKVAQLQSTHAGRPKLTSNFFDNKAKLDSMYGNGAGMINPAFDETMQETIERRNKLQQYMRSKTRLGIPIIFIDEAHHGLVQRNVDVFPHGIGMASSWDTSLITKIYTYVAGQARSRGTSLVLAPVVDVTRDPRWGRTGETWGEDPFYNGVVGTAVVKGFQGSSNGIIAPNHVAATLKHFTGHGQPEGGNNQGPSNYSERTLREAHMEPFRMIVRDAKPSCIMASYDEVAEVPSHANKWLLTDVLRNEWNYKGVVVSDWFGIDQLWNKHLVAADQKDAALKAFNAGVNIDLPYGINYQHLTALATEGKLNMVKLDSAVACVLRIKFQMGLFEEKDIDLNQALAYNKRTEGRTMALKIAEESMVLLKNEGILPIKKDQYKKIAVIGPFGNVNLVGDYSGIPSSNTTIVQGLKNKGADVQYARGCYFTKNGDSVSINNFQFIDTTIMASREENMKLIDEAVTLARNSDFIVLAIGENEQFSREAWAPNHFGDMTDLNLQSQQEELVKAIAALGKPYVVYLMHGRPLSINWIAANAPAIVDGWYMGEEAGNAFANILYGDVNPSGKLTISYPRSVGQIPIFYNHKPSAQFYQYVTETNKPLFAFGHGLSYTTYQYGKPSVAGNTVSISVTNAGQRDGDEIVQLYVHQKVSDVVRPVKELKGFQRVHLRAGETKSLSFTITPEMLKHWNIDMKFVADRGLYEIMVGPSSDRTQSVEYRYP